MCECLLCCCIIVAFLYCRLNKEFLLLIPKIWKIKVLCSWKMCPPTVSQKKIKHNYFSFKVIFISNCCLSEGLAFIWGLCCVHFPRSQSFIRCNVSSTSSQRQMIINTLQLGWLLFFFLRMYSCVFGKCQSVRPTHSHCHSYWPTAIVQPLTL